MPTGSLAHVTEEVDRRSRFDGRTVVPIAPGTGHQFAVDTATPIWLGIRSGFEIADRSILPQ